MLEGYAFVTEITSDLIHSVESANQEALEIKLE